MKPRNVHIVPTGTRPGWRVTSATLTLSVHHTQRRAIVAGIRLARRNRLDVVTHARNGRIRSKDSYGNERPAHDREH
jgi:hypothetical protein